MSAPGNTAKLGGVPATYRQRKVARPMLGSNLQY